MTLGIDVDVRLNANCDKCNGKFGDGDIAYCSSCWQDLVDDIKDKDKEIESWEADLSKAMNKIEDLETQVKSL